MKFMLNGALTLGTMDGANVEIAQSVGDENIFIFGSSSKKVMKRYELMDYDAKDYYESDPNIKKALDFIVGEEMLAVGKEENLRRLYNEMINKDWFQTLPDFNAYVVRKKQAMEEYCMSELAWSRKVLMNIAKAGFFSTDRTIKQYNEEIWHLDDK